MKYLALVPVFYFILIGCAVSIGDAKREYKDRDWNLPFKSSCKVANNDSIAWQSEDVKTFVRFQLSDQDVGGCPNDNKPRHSAPYWERAELQQLDKLQKNQVYNVKAILRFTAGFEGDREAFFQVHSYNSSCTHAGPPIMLKFDDAYTGTSVLVLSALQDDRRHITHRSDLHIDEVMGDWITIQLTFDTTENPKVTLHVNGERLFSDIPFWIEPCGKPYITMGVYRPGNLSGNMKSVVDYDSIELIKTGTHR